MDKFEWFLLIILAILFCSFSYAVIKTAQDIREGMNDVVIKEQERRKEDIRTRCAVYYNDGTGRWIECMGVGYVQSQ